MRSPTFLACCCSFLLIKSVLSLRQDPVHRKVLATASPRQDATGVNVSLTISKMKITNPLTMEVHYEVGLHQQWMDPRVAHDDTSLQLVVAGSVWQPKLTFAAGRVIPHPDVTSQFWRGWGHGNVLNSERYTIFTDCSTNFQLYPFDTQRCLIKITSFSFPMDEVVLKWNINNALELSCSKDLISFQLADFFTFTEIERRPSGNFTVLVAELMLSRHNDRTLVLAIGTCVTMVVISYLALWLSIDACLTRVLMSLTSLLTIFVIHQNMYDVPRTPYFKPSDTWTILCTVYAALPLIQTVALAALNKHHARQHEEIMSTSRREKKRFIASSVDCVFQIMHPLLFLSCCALFVVFCAF